MADEALMVLEPEDLDSSKELRKLVTGQRKLLLKVVISLGRVTSDTCKASDGPPPLLKEVHPPQESINTSQTEVPMSTMLPGDKFMTSLLEGTSSKWTANPFLVFSRHPGLIHRFTLKQPLVRHQ